MKKILLLCSLFISLSAHAYVERDLLQKAADPAKLESVLLTDQQWVKYPAYTDRAGWNRLIGSNKEDMIARGERYLDYDWRVVKATDYLDYARTGSRQNMNAHDSNLAAISALFMAELAEGEGRFTESLADGVFHLCEMTSWAISAHMSLQRAGGTLPNLGDHVIELVSGDVGATLSWIYYFMNKEFDKTSPLISRRLHHEITERILTPYLNETRFWWMATTATAENPVMVNNWNVWCNANVLQSFLLIEKDRERLLAGVYKTMVSVDKFINYNHEDGACEEGPSYWGHAAGKMYDYLQVLYDATGGKVSLFSDPMIRNMGEYISRSYVGNGWVVNFADASARENLDYRLIYRYGNAVGSTEMEHFASYLKNLSPARMSVSRDTYRTLADLTSDAGIDRFTPVHAPTPFTWYPETEFCYMSSGSWFFAAKGGYNDESHNHNDTGTFSLYADGEPVMIDAGVGTYTAKTFSSDRYSIWTMQSDYHNVPQINGFAQSFGKRYKARDLKAEANRKAFSLDISPSYPAGAGVNKWVRSYKLSGSGVEIGDSFDIANPQNANRLNFMTWGETDISVPGVVGITVKGKTYRLLYDKNAFDVTLETIEQDDTRLSRVWGDEITKISLTAKQISGKGNYRISIKN